MNHDLNALLDFNKIHLFAEIGKFKTRLSQKIMNLGSGATHSAAYIR